MFCDNLKVIRKNKGFTQEELASKVNVVRQTVSKWEKGLSVPDAEILQKIADVLEVTVNELLGSPVQDVGNSNEIAEQLSKLNEQLIIKNRRSKRIWKILGIIGIAILSVTVLSILIISIGVIPYHSMTNSASEVINTDQIAEIEEIS